MIRCIAIDDEPLALTQLSGYIRKTPFLDLRGTFNSALESMDLLVSGLVDLIFIDINMPDISGMDFVKSLKNKPLIIFTTAYSEYALEGFKVDAIDYLLKPFSYNDFLKSANKAQHQHELLTQAKEASVTKESNYLFVKTDHKLVKIEINHIEYIESQSEYIRIFLDNKTHLMPLLSLKAIEKVLPAPQFMRVHRSYIINLDKIKEVTKNQITLDNNSTIPIGDMYKENFKMFLIEREA